MRVVRMTFKKPRPLRVHKTKRRECLKCRKPFPSHWPGERVCNQCKTSASWRQDCGQTIE